MSDTFVKILRLNEDMPDRRQVNAERTRDDLVRAAFELFGTRGFRDVSIDDICRDVGLSRGGFYHHFANKEDCFEAVWTHLQLEWATQSAASYLKHEHLDAGDQARAGLIELFEFWAEPKRRRINLLDAAIALGWERIRELTGEHGTKAVADMLAGLGKRNDRLFAQLVSAAIGEAVFHVGDPEHHDDAPATAEAVITMIEGLPANEPE